MTELCKTCRKPKANYHCGICQDPTCKACTHFVGEDTFSYLKKVPEILTHTTYCTPCFDETVSETLNNYNATMDKARDIIIYSKDQSKITRFLKRKEPPYQVENCEDEQEAVMRLSFKAAEAGFNCLIDVQFTTKKTIVGSHKKTIYAATAVPITIDPNEIRGHEDPP